MHKKIITAIDKNGNCNTTKNVQDFDHIVNTCQPVSETVDNLILELYPPLNVPNMETQVSKNVIIFTACEILT